MAQAIKDFHFFTVSLLSLRQPISQSFIGWVTIQLKILARHAALSFCCGTLYQLPVCTGTGLNIASKLLLREVEKETMMVRGFRTLISMSQSLLTTTLTIVIRVRSRPAWLTKCHCI